MEKKRGLSGDKTKATTLGTHGHMPTASQAPRNILYRTPVDQEVFLRGSKVSAGKEIAFEGDLARVESHVSMSVKHVDENKRGLTSSSKKKEIIEQPEVEKAVLQAPQILFKNQGAQLQGVDVGAQELHNQTQDGLEVGPKITQHLYQMQSQQGNALKGVKISVDQGGEVAVPTSLDVKKIVSNGSVLRRILTDPTTEIPLTVEGIYEESLRTLTQWNEQKVKGTGIPAPVLMVVALATSMTTGGFGGTLLASGLGPVSTAAISGLTSMIGSSLITSGHQLYHRCGWTRGGE